LRIAAAPDGADRIGALERLAALRAGPLGDRAAAAEHYHAILALAPDHQGALRALERYHLADGNSAQLAALYERLAAAADDPQLALAALRARARCRQQLGEPDVTEDLRAALARDPAHLPTARRLLAGALAARATDEVVALCDRVAGDESVDPTSAAVF